MRRLFTIAAAALACATVHAAVTPPSIAFRPKGVTIGGLRPGTRIAWLAMLRDRVTQRPRVSITRGLEPVKPNGALDIDGERTVTQSIWIVAAIDDDVVLKSAAPGYPTSGEPIEIVANEGTGDFSVRSNSIQLLYVRRQGAGAWSFAAADGSDLDADHLENGWITVPLKSLQRFHGSANPPDTVSSGDLILAIDTVELRSSTLQVRK